MPDFSISDALAEAYASAPAAEVVLHTLEFRHGAFPSPVRVVRDRQDFTATLEATAPANPGESVTFVALGFDFALPTAERATVSEIEITLDNAAAELMPYLDLAAQSEDLIEVTYRPYLASDPSGPQTDPPVTMTVMAASADVFRVRARAGFADLANRRFPSEIYDGERFPGLAA